MVPLSAVKTDNDLWFDRGYQDGFFFAGYEATYEDLAAIYHSEGIPANWDIFRAEILNRFLGVEGFNFKAYTAGFTKACTEQFARI